MEERLSRRIIDQYKFLEGVLDAMDHPFYVIDVEDYSVVLANDAARSLGIDAHLTCYQLTHHRDVPCNTSDRPCPLVTVRKTLKPCVVEHVHYKQDGTPYFTEIHGFPLLGEDGKLQFMVEYSMDISDRRRTESKLRRLQSAVQFSANAVVVTDLVGIIEYVNPAFTEITGYLPEDVIGKNPKVLKSGEHSPEFYKNMWTTILSGTVWRGEFINRRKDGQLYWEYQTIAPIKDEFGNITNFVAIKENITERKKTQLELERLAVTDPLTGLMNRRGFFAQAEAIFSRTPSPPRGALSMIMLDIDFFKRVNDKYGHLAGDEVLREVSRRIKDTLRPNDFLGRCGGEEFIIVLPRLSEEQAVIVAERLRASIAGKLVVFEGIKIDVTISLGVASKNEETHTLDELVRRADEMLYQAKNSGRNQWAVFKRD